MNVSLCLRYNISVNELIKYTHDAENIIKFENDVVKLAENRHLGCIFIARITFGADEMVKGIRRGPCNITIDNIVGFVYATYMVVDCIEVYL